MRRVELPLPGLYNVYNAVGAAALAVALEIGLDEIVDGLARVAPAFGRAETVAIDGRELCILLIKNPAGANEVLRTLALEPGDHDLIGVLNDKTADGHDVSWIWDADFEAIATRIRRATCSGTRAAELALRLKYAGVPSGRISARPEPCRRPRRGGRRRRGRGNALRPADLYGDARAPRAARQARRGRQLVGTRMTTPAVIWHDVECGGYTADLPVWLDLAARAGGPVLDIGAGTGRVALCLARAGHDVHALERDPTLAEALRQRAAGLPVHTTVGDACDFSTRVEVALCIVPMQTIHLLDDRPAFLRCAHAALAPGGLLAIALLGEGVEEFEMELGPDRARVDGVTYESRPTALRFQCGAIVLERRRRTKAGNLVESADDLVRLAVIDPAELSAEAAAVGLHRLESSWVAPTADQVGSEIVMFVKPEIVT